jgi:SAM-dependent methyltransferase
MENFNAYSRYYDLLYRDKDYAAEVRYISEVFSRYHSGKVQNILDLGCGSGSHAYYFAESGYSVTGIERSAEMVSRAMAKNILNFTPLVGDISAFHLEQRFEAVIALFHVISYLIENTPLVSCFRAVHNHLQDGGLFVFDVWYSPAVWAQQPETRVKRLEDAYTQVTRIAEPVVHANQNVVDVNYEVWVKETAGISTEIIRETHPMRHFGYPEIDLLARLTGFELLGSEAFLSGDEPGSDTWGVCFILKKRHE